MLLYYRIAKDWNVTHAALLGEPPDAGVPPVVNWYKIIDVPMSAPLRPVAHAVDIPIPVQALHTFAVAAVANVVFHICSLVTGNTLGI